MFINGTSFGALSIPARFFTGADLSTFISPASNSVGFAKNEMTKTTTITITTPCKTSFNRTTQSPLIFWNAFMFFYSTLFYIKYCI